VISSIGLPLYRGVDFRNNFLKNITCISSPSAFPIALNDLDN